MTVTEKVADTLVQHPFFPPEIKLMGYVANEYSMLELLAGFFSTWGLILAVTYVVSTRLNPKMNRTDTLCVLWFVLTGTIHFFFEGYFAVNHSRMAGQQDLFGQLWKEYSYSDSRYLTSDPFVLCMESVTAFLWGPLSFLTIYLITSESPYRYSVQAIVSLGQIYGCVLYYATNTFDMYYNDTLYCRPEPIYFWFYYVIINAIWMVIPGSLLYQSIEKHAVALRSMAKGGKALANGSANGSAKKNR